MCADAANSFPDGFTWGTATAAHQIEGGNVNNDWWRFEHTPGTMASTSSGDATDSYHRWRDDADIIASIGLDNYRFSLEWSRIEPADGEFSQAALDHYARMCEGLKERGIDPVVTFHHFTTPIWMADRGGWQNPDIADRFAAFVERAAARLDGLMTKACTINEPNMVAFVGYVLGAFPPGKQEPVAVLDDINPIFVDAHRKAVEVIRSASPGTPVGLTVSCAEWEAVESDDPAEAGMAARRTAEAQAYMEDVFFDAAFAADGTPDDFLGIQTYSRTRMGPRGALGPEEGVEALIMGYEYWPQSLEATLRRAWAHTGGRIPLLVTENGIGTDDDDQRIRYVREALEGVLRAIADGVDVRGYTCWSLLDNFEWAFGYGPRFGLVDVDRSTFVRTPKPSASWLGEVAAANALPT